MGKQFLSNRACVVFKRLRGLVCLYKCPDSSVQFLTCSLGEKLCDDLNSLQGDRPTNYLDIEKDESGNFLVDIRPSYYDNVLARGPKYSQDNIFLRVSGIGRRSSGVCRINDGTKYVKKWSESNPLKVFHIKGMLGQATQYFYKDDKVVARGKYDKIQKSTLDKVLSSFEAAHQRKIFSDLGIDIKSQKAYEIAVNGMLRLPPRSIPCIYSIKCIDFTSPHFTLEISCINDNENYFLKLIHDLGLQLRAFAHCTGIRCIRYGPFTTKHALIIPQYSLRNIFRSMQQCRDLTKKYMTNTFPPFLRSGLASAMNEQVENTL